MDFGDNIWDVDWDEPGEYEADAERAGFGGVRGKRLRRQLGATLSAAVWELDPGGSQAPYHFHHGGEEILIVLKRNADTPLAGGRARAEGGRGRPLPARPRGRAPGRSTAPTRSRAT